MSKAIRVKLVKGFYGSLPAHRATVRGLGLRRINHERILKDTPEVRGMVRKITHLVQIVEEGLTYEAPAKS